MSVGRKRASSDGGGPPPKRGVMARTADKWIVENDKPLNTATWLKYDKADREYVATLKCSVCIEFQDKLRGMRNYNPVQEEYKVVWWKLFNTFDAKKWSNILSLVELLFCLPTANGRVERTFSQLKIIKTERRTCLGIDRLDSLLRITTDAPPLSKWDASGAVQRWWGDKTRRGVKDSRAPPKRKENAPEDDSDSDHPYMLT